MCRSSHCNVGTLVIVLIYLQEAFFYQKIGWVVEKMQFLCIRWIQCGYSEWTTRFASSSVMSLLPSIKSNKICTKSNAHKPILFSPSHLRLIWTIYKQSYCLTVIKWWRYISACNGHSKGQVSCKTKTLLPGRRIYISTAVKSIITTMRRILSGVVKCIMSTQSASLPYTLGIICCDHIVWLHK